MNTIVLGIGNRLMMDDGIGVYVVEELIKNYKMDNITYIIGETDLDYCIDAISAADKLIIIDSLYSGYTPGTVKVFPLHENDYKGRLELSLHNTNIIDVIKSRYMSIIGIIIGVEVHELNYAIGLSKHLKEKFSRIIKEISDIIKVENNI